MGTQPLHDDALAALDAEHKALKEQTARLRHQHNRLHAEGGTKEDHQRHIRHLRQKVRELEAHVKKLKNLRKPT
ncbi:MAG TPA: hypothetical protein VGJ78_24295 [Vicinamibacterales bacterium]|jgi:seryl-tRNA synthetase